MKQLSIDKLIPKPSLKNEDFKIEILLEKSIKKYGQLYPIIVNEVGEIIKGNTIFKILKKLNYSSVWVNVVEGRIDSQLCIELNLLKGEPNPIDCFELMKSVDLKDNCLPYNKQQIIEFIDLLNFDWNMYKKQKNSIASLF